MVIVFGYFLELWMEYQDGTWDLDGTGKGIWGISIGGTRHGLGR